MTAFALFARNEARLAGRDLVSFLTQGRRRRLRTAAIWFVFVVGLLHLVAFTALRPLDLDPAGLDRQTLAFVTGAGFLSWTLMLAQAMEAVTRVLYGRADLDLVLSSPTPLTALFAMRTGLAAIGTIGMSLFLIAPFINMAALLHGPGWLGAYGVMLALGAVAAAAAVLLTLGLFALIGPARTRWVAQIVAAVIGAGFVIVAQGAGILLYGDPSRFAVLASPDLLATAPPDDSLAWWPARAAAGDPTALAAVIAVGAAFFLATAAFGGARFARIAVEAAGVGAAGPAARVRRRAATFSAASPVAHLRAKELRLIARDPWLISQTLMQILYLLPPALMLWVSFGRSMDAPMMLAPIVVMAAGQLAGGLAWLTISGEDAPDLVATAPIRPATAVRAKVEAVLLGVFLPVFPLIAAVSLVSPRTGVVTAVFVALATACSTFIQFLFRTHARRSDFRRRQTASRIATFAEAFASISWAATAGLAAAGSPVAVVPGAIAAAVVAIAWAASPRRG